MRKKEIHSGTVKKLKFPNKGLICDLDGITDAERKEKGEEIPYVIVKNVLPGQRITFAVSNKKNKRYEGRVLEVLEKSPIQTEDYFCRNGERCGGCSYQTLAYEEQLNLKTSMVKDLIKDQVDEDGGIWEDTVESPERSGYRNKMEYSFGNEYKDGPLMLGLHKKGSLYDVITCDDCKLVDEDFNKLVKTTLEYCRDKELPLYNKIIHVGYLRHFLLRRSATDGGLLVHIITSSQFDHDFSELGEIYKGLNLTGHIEGFIHIINDRVADTVQCDEYNIIFGADHLTEEILGLKFNVSTFSFFQTNTRGAEMLYSVAREYIYEASSGRKSTVYDLYTGTGTIAQMMASEADRVVGVEIVEDAVKAAMENAELNGLGNCEFICGDVLNVLDDLKEKPDLIILDPPREGIHPRALQKIISYGVENIVYISCKPTSLKKDLLVMRDNGYTVRKIRCVDMFPFTGHVETVVLLCRKAEEADRHITVEYYPEGRHMETAPLDASYGRIAKWIEENYNGMKVHTLYIAQVKRKYGLIERENYNKSKNPDAKVPECPPEKEEAIVDALKHFRMI
ncbi:MAG: 23S rRNA (uracil(1939)-C(5))-methyltransferase RlmD [Lachnospiraceae bacterium]|nr:23S rRNA (uracil(1939)-C(5))-methyltransferase RlmD [Lachnospiraceae bacterium]